MLNSISRKAYSEIYAFLNIIDKEAFEKIPREVREFFKREKDNYYSASIDIKRLLKEKRLIKETYDIIAYLNLKYWCQDSKEKREYREILIQNELERIKKSMNRK